MGRTRRNLNSLRYLWATLEPFGLSGGDHPCVVFILLIIILVRGSLTRQRCGVRFQTTTTIIPGLLQL